jgi:hypothetical protein
MSSRHQVRHGHPTFLRSRSEGVGALIGGHRGGVGGGSPSRRTPRRTNSSINNNSSSSSDKFRGLKWMIVAIFLNIFGVYCISYVLIRLLSGSDPTNILTPEVKVWLEENDLKQHEEYFQSLGKFLLLFLIYFALFERYAR